MSNENHPGNNTPKSGRGSKAITVAVTLTTVLVCLLAVGYSRTDLGSAASSYEKNKKAAIDAGLFFDSNQVAELYSVPASENGADLVSQVLKIPKENHWDRETTLTEALVNQKRDVFEAALAKLEEASKRKYLIFKRNISQASAITYPEFSDEKDWVKLLSTMARFARERNDSASARRYLKLAAYLSRVSDSEAILIGQLVRIAEAAIVERELKNVLESRGKEPVWQETVRQTLAVLDKPYDVRTAMSIEHWFASSSVDQLLKNPTDYLGSSGFSSLPAELKYGRYLPRFGKANMSRIHEAYTELVTRLPKDPYDFATTRSAFEGMDAYTSKPGMSYVVLGLVAPVFSQATQAMAREVAIRSALEQALALLTKRANPAKGLPLKDRRTLDLDGKPLRLKQVNGHWILYSVGNDKIDDGGKEETKGKGDWVIHLPK